MSMTELHEQKCKAFGGILVAGSMKPTENEADLEVKMIMSIWYSIIDMSRIYITFYIYM